ncbi:MAG: hypothetical protein JWP44_5084 [Mucilaginibacter sp.]|nr:hypothetical protein [Mucilaginibacter sp.]
MTVRAKFKVTNVNDLGEGLKSISMMPVYGGSPENDQFFKYTPSGQITIGTINAAAAEQFNLNQEFYVDFTPASVPAPVAAPTEVI